MSTIGTNSEDLILNADGSGSDIKFKSNGTEVASISDGGVVTATSFAGSGANLTGVGVAGITSSADATAMTITSDEKIGIGTTSPTRTVDINHASTAPDLRLGCDGNDAPMIIMDSDVSSADDAVAHQVFRWNNTDIALITAYAGADTTNKDDGGLTFKTRTSGSALATRLDLTSDGRGLSQFTAKAWSTHNQHGTLSVGDSHNVSSITDVGTGNFRLHFSNNMGGTNYTWTGFCTYWGGSYNDASNMEQDSVDANNSSGQNNNNLTLHTMANLNGATTSTLTDMQVVNVVVFGD